MLYVRRGMYYIHFHQGAGQTAHPRARWPAHCHLGAGSFVEGNVLRRRHPAIHHTAVV
jgi:hypothetical protein